MISERLMIAAPLTPNKVGKYYEKMPQHLTLLPWFELGSDSWSTLDIRLQEIAEEERLGAIIASKRDAFGPDNSIQVSRLAGVMFGVHAALHGAVRALGSEFDTSYTGLEWSPHVSDSDGHNVDVGHSLVLQDMSVYRKELGGCSVKASYRFGSV